MTVVKEYDVRIESTRALSPDATPSTARRLYVHIGQNRADFVLATVLAVLTAVTRIWNLAGYPRWFTDEGVYVSQAWAVANEQALAPYTYWYDHPPLGWLQIAGWGALTGSWNRNPDVSVMVGRELMVVMAVASVVLTYVLARRLGMRQSFATVAALLYCLSPLAVTFSRYVLLDNIAAMWLLAAMVLALSPKRRIMAVFGSCLTLAIAVLSKETALLTAPAVIWMLWHNFRHAPNWKTAKFVFFTTAPTLFLLYPIYAAIKNELTPGPDHVSLWQGQVLFQLTSRAGSGSIFDDQSNARLLISDVWLSLDPWLPIIGVLAILPALFVPKLRGITLALGLQVAIVLKGGYLPYPFIITLLPFMALLIGGLADAYWPSGNRWKQGGWEIAEASILTFVFLVVGSGFGYTLWSAWPQQLTTAFTANDTAYQKQAVDWVAANVPKYAQVVAEGELWMDLRRTGFDSPEVIWTYKVDTDPEVKAVYKDKNGLDYLVLNKSTFGVGDLPTLTDAIKDATPIASFGPDGPNQIVVLKVDHTG